MGAETDPEPFVAVVDEDSDALPPADAAVTEPPGDNARPIQQRRIRERLSIGYDGDIVGIAVILLAQQVEQGSTERRIHWRLHRPLTAGVDMAFPTARSFAPAT